MHLAAQSAHASKQGIAFIAGKGEALFCLDVERLRVVPVLEVSELFGPRQKLRWVCRNERLAETGCAGKAKGCDC